MTRLLADLAHPQHICIPGKWIGSPAGQRTLAHWMCPNAGPPYHHRCELRTDGPIGRPKRDRYMRTPAGRIARGGAQVLFVMMVIWLLAGAQCAPDDALLLPSRTSRDEAPADGVLIARLVHVSDTHVVDSLSPARYAGAQAVIPSAWRAWENCSTQIFDGILRQANRIHASGESIDFLVHTGDACDNAQHNELDWFVQILDGGAVSPLSGPDDRAADNLPAPELDPYAAFEAQGLYRAGIHGESATIPWFVVMGNHDTLGIGVFSIVSEGDGDRRVPLPLSGRPGIWIPDVLDPVGSWTHGPVTPAEPGPPRVLELLTYVDPNPQRRYFSKAEFVARMFETASGPPGHGFHAVESPTWYSVSPVPGLRLIGLDTSDYVDPIPGLPYQEGCVSRAQVEFLSAELEAAAASGEWVIITSHHPSNSMELAYGSALGPEDLRGLLQQYPNVIAHLNGHAHRNRVADRGSYVEITTCSTIDAPQEARVVELWRDADGRPVIVYRMFDGLSEELPPLGADPLHGLRERASELARPGKRAENMRGVDLAADDEAAADPLSREGAWRRSW